jgi:hypothetical protein
LPPDQVEPTPHAKHAEAFFGHQLQPHEIKDVISASWQKVAHGFNRFVLRGVDNIGRPESSGRVPQAALLLPPEWKARAATRVYLCSTLERANRARSWLRTNARRSVGSRSRQINGWDRPDVAHFFDVTAISKKSTAGL